MRYTDTRIIVFGIILASGPTAIAQPSPEPAVIAKPPKNYESPSAVFDAYREAISKGDAQTQYYCQVPEIRIDVHQAFCCGGMARAIRPELAPPINAVLKKFGVEMTTVEAEYFKHHKAKHGVDLEKQMDEYSAKRDKAIADYEKVHGKDKYGAIPQAVQDLVGSAPQPDLELFRKVVTEMVVRKDEFVIAAMAAARDPKNPELPPGPLKNLVVKGDTATGETSGTVVSYGGPDSVGKPDGKVIREVSRPVRFRKTGNGWLISGFDGEPPAPVAPPKSTPGPGRP